MPVIGMLRGGVKGMADGIATGTLRSKRKDRDYAGQQALVGKFKDQELYPR